MIIETDYIIKKIGHKRRDKFYRIYCNNCGSDRGYLLKTQNKRLSCNKCSKVGIMVSNETRKKMSEAALGNRNSAHNYIKKDKQKKDKKKRIYIRNDKLLSDIQRKIRHNMRSLLWSKIKKRNINKNNKTFNILGYTPDELKAHLESKFQPGMSWDNYGQFGWHIDHIIPDSWFKYDSIEDEDFKKSWSLDNLQPLWAQDNHSKSNKIGDITCHKP